MPTGRTNVGYTFCNVFIVSDAKKRRKKSLNNHRINLQVHSALAGENLKVHKPHNGLYPEQDFGVLSRGAT